MHERKFSFWESWSYRDLLPGLEYPGVYAIARSTKRLAGRPFTWHPDIIYIGMTNGVLGLAGRLRQFDLTINGDRLAHGGADRVRLKYKSYARLVAKLFVAVAPFRCCVTSGQPADLRKMGDVAQFEFYCFAEYVDRRCDKGRL